MDVQSVRIAEMKDAVLARSEEAPSGSTRSIVKELGVDRQLVRNVVRDEGFHLYHCANVHWLQPQNLDARLNY